MNGIWFQKRPGDGCGSNFNQNWAAYKAGFGDTTAFNCDFWLGLDKIYMLTNSPGRNFQLHVSLQFQDNAHSYLQSYYSGFRLSDEADGFRAQLSGYIAGDGLTVPLRHIALDF